MSQRCDNVPLFVVLTNGGGTSFSGAYKAFAHGLGGPCQPVSVHWSYRRPNFVTALKCPDLVRSTLEPSPVFIRYLHIAVTDSLFDVISPQLSTHQVLSRYPLSMVLCIRLLITVIFRSQYLARCQHYQITFCSTLSNSLYPQSHLQPRLLMTGVGHQLGPHAAFHISAFSTSSFARLFSALCTQIPPPPPSRMKMKP